MEHNNGREKETLPSPACPFCLFSGARLGKKKLREHALPGMSKNQGSVQMFCFDKILKEVGFENFVFAMLASTLRSFGRFYLIKACFQTLY